MFSAIVRGLSKACLRSSKFHQLISQILKYSNKKYDNEKYLEMHEIEAVQYLKSRGVDFGSRFNYKQKVYNTKTKKLKIAVCMSGFMRTYQDTSYAFIKNVLEPLNADLFIYTPSMTGVSWVASKELHNKIISQDDQKSDLITMEKIYEYYPKDKVKKCVIWDYDESIFNDKKFEFGAHNTWDGRDYKRIISFFYHIEKCNELKKTYEEEHNFKYDIVIRLRADLSFVTEFNLDRVVGDVNLNNTIYYNAFNHINDNGRRYIDAAFICPFMNLKEGMLLPNGEYYFNDFITIGTSENIDNICNLYSNIPQYMLSGIGYNPETLFFYHIIKNQLNIAMEDITTCKLLRENDKLLINEYTDKTSADVIATRANNYIRNFHYFAK